MYWLILLWVLASVPAGIAVGDFLRNLDGEE
jgi:hypothetical protein